jgi:hypothetical protein
MPKITPRGKEKRVTAKIFMVNNQPRNIDGKIDIT